MTSALGDAVRSSGGRIVSALAARFRDLDIAEDAFADACLKAVEAWATATPDDPAAWLYRVAQRAAVDRIRRAQVRQRLHPDEPEPPPTPEDAMSGDTRIPDERLRLIFVCCHPAVAIDARAALTLRLVCSLSTAEIARAFLLSEAALAQRLVRAKRKIADAGVGFEVPRPEAWPERVDAVLSTLEVAYSKAHEDAAGAGPHAGYAAEMLDLTRTLADMMPGEPDVLALAALVRYAEARRPARLDASGMMIPLSEQDPRLWRRDLIAEANALIDRIPDEAPSARALQTAIHACWCARRSLAEPPPWRSVLALYDRLLQLRDDAVVRLNRAVALAEVAGPEAALDEVDALDTGPLASFAPYHAVRADLLRRLGRNDEARAAYDAALALDPAPAEQLFLAARRRQLA